MDKAAAAGNNEFQSTRPVWGATMCTSRRRSSATISIHAPRVGRDRAAHDRSGAVVISIHAPRVGRDGGKGHAGRGHQHFNPRAPCGARRNIKKKPPSRIKISIHAPRVGRDDKWGQLVYDKQDFNPRAPCGARRGCIWCALKDSAFQSTRPVWGATMDFSLAGLSIPLFQSTRPVWGATSSSSSELAAFSNFNPRAPCGARPI